MDLIEIGNGACYQGDCLEAMRSMLDAGFAGTIHSVVTDPPYGIGFMGRSWDSARTVAFDPATWRLAYDLLAPGGHLLAFGGSRTYHRLACAVEDAGFEVRDQIMWIYGSGFPKSVDVSKAIDKRRDDRAAILEVTAFLATARDVAGLKNSDIDAAFGTAGMAGHWTSVASQPLVPRWEQWLALESLLTFGDKMDAEVWRLNGRKGKPGDAWSEREIIGQRTTGIGTGQGNVAMMGDGGRNITAPATAEAVAWQGWGSALKPAHEPIVVARKPLIGTVAENVLAHGCGAMNIDGCRVPGAVNSNPAMRNVGHFASSNQGPTGQGRDSEGRWPANVIHDGSDEVLDAFAVYGERAGGSATPRSKSRADGYWLTADTVKTAHADKGTAARFFMTCEQDAPNTLSCIAEIYPVATQEVMPSCQLVCAELVSHQEAEDEHVAFAPMFAQESPSLESGGSGHPSCDTASGAGSRLTHSNLTTGYTVPLSAVDTTAALNARHASGAEIRSPLCETPTAQSPARASTKITSRSMELSMSATPTESKPISESNTTTIQPTGYDALPGQQPERHIPSRNRAETAGTPRPTDTTISDTTAQPTSNGSAASATSSATSKNSAPGAVDFPANSRFIYAAKASKSERAGSKHPTVKPLSLMRYLVRLVTPPGGVVLDPFAGSGTTLEAAIAEGFCAVGCEMTPEYYPDIERRLRRCQPHLSVNQPA